MRLKLFDGGEYYAHFDRDALVEMDAKTAAEVASIEIGSGVLLVNERRRKRQRPDVVGGDIPLVNSTYISLERALTAPPPPKGPPNAPA